MVQLNKKKWKVRQYTKEAERAAVTGNSKTQKRLAGTFTTRGGSIINKNGTLLTSNNDQKL